MRKAQTEQPLGPATKLPEEGEIWEWRAFGRISRRLDEKIRAHPIRMGLSDLPAEDVYFVSWTSDQNIKLRRSSGESVLKFKLLLATERRAIELYSETAASTFKFPVTADKLREAARLLETNLPEAALSIPEFSEEEFTLMLAAARPPVLKVTVAKVRSQFEVNGGWIELADVVFPRERVQTVALQSPDIATVEKLIEELKPGSELEPMNYVEACRRWG